MQVSTQSIYIFMVKTRCQKTIKYKGNLSTKLLFPQNDENALTTFLHSSDDLLVQSSHQFKTAALVSRDSVTPRVFCFLFLFCFVLFCFSFVFFVCLFCFVLFCFVVFCFSSGFFCCCCCFVFCFVLFCFFPHLFDTNAPITEIMYQANKA